MPFEKLKTQFPLVRCDEPLKNHSTFRVGGPADFFYELTNIEELPALIIFAEENAVPYRIIGRGTNVLFRDEGFRGLIIKNLSSETTVADTEITSDSGVILANIVRLSIDNNLTGLEPLYGLPGTLGGAICGNAGVPDTEISKFLTMLTVFNAADGVREIRLPSSEVKFGYRESSLQKSKDVVLRATLSLQKGAKEKSKELMQKIDAIRRGKQPIGYSAGSFFKNPSREKPAGMLIDQAGLKGKRIGDAEISPKHGNFFINTGHATAKQILELADLAKREVKAKFGIELEMEVKII